MKDKQDQIDSDINCPEPKHPPQRGPRRPIGAIACGIDPRPSRRHPACRPSSSKLHEQLAAADITGPGLNRGAVGRVFPPHGKRNPFAVHPARNRKRLARAREVGAEVLVGAGQLPIRIDRLDHEPGMVVEPRRPGRKHLAMRGGLQCKQAGAQGNQSKRQQRTSPLGI
jgi:hypothetical protein